MTLTVNDPANLSIRPAQPQDLEMLYDICRQAYSENFSNHWNPGGLEWYLEKVYSLAGIKEDLRNSGIRYFISFADSKPAGFMKLRLNANLDGHEGAGLEIEKIYFRPAFQGMGLGKLMMTQAFQTATHHEKKIVWLGVIDTNFAAFAFYKKLGFDEYDKVKLDLPYFKDELKGMWRMVKIL